MLNNIKGRKDDLKIWIILQHLTKLLTIFNININYKDLF